MKRILTLIALLAVLLTAIPNAPFQASPVCADEEKWGLVETIVTPASGTLEGRYGYHSWSVSGITMDHWFRYTTGPETADNHQQFTFTIPTVTLIPGDTIDLTVTGTSDGSDPTISGETFEYSAEGVTLNGTTKVTAGFFDWTGPTTETASFVVPEVSSERLVITASMFTALGESPEGFSVQWVYEAGPPKVIYLDLKHYPPFDYFKTFDYSRPETAVNIAPAGDLVVRMTDGEGKPVEGELVYFYAVKELNPSQLEPGKNLRGILKPLETDEDDQRSYEIPFHVLYQALDIDEETYLASAYTDENGEARVNYLNLDNFDPKEFAIILQRQTASHNVQGREDAKIGGTIKAVVVEDYDLINEEILETIESMPVTIEFRALAKILKITGEGQPDDTDLGRDYPGRVRVKREWSYERFPYEPVEEGFLLMPGDKISIDGGTAVEIVWANGNRGLARVPSTIKVEDSELPVPQAKMQLMCAAYESDFITPVDTAATQFFGASLGKGIEFLMVTLGGIYGAVVHFGINVFRHGEWSFEEHGVTTKIRVRSTVLIDTTGEEVSVFNIEGSPDVKTVAGSEITLNSGEMVTVSDEGVMGTPEAFNVQAVESDFYQDIPIPASDEATGGDPSQTALPRSPLTQQPEGESPSSGGSGFSWYFVAAGVAFILLIVVLVRRKRKQA